MAGKTDGAPLTCVSLFAGGGGLTLGVQAAGFKILLATDADENSEATFRLNQPHTPFLKKDIRRIQKDDLLPIIGKGKVDLIIGGPPCQGFSTIGDQILGDSRNHLFWSFLRIVKWLNPTCFLIENVNYLRSQYAGKYEGEITRAFGSEGYRVYVSTLNSADFGVPQIRRRAFFVGTKLRGDFSWPTPTHSEAPGGLTKPYATVREAIMDIANASSVDVPNHLALNHSERVIRRYKLIPEGGRMPPPQELPPDIRRRNFGNTYKRLHRDKPSLTLVPGNNAFPIHPTQDRSLTPREAARLQGFPDSYVLSGNRANQCRLIGNAVPVDLAQRLAAAIRTHFKEKVSSSLAVSKDPGFESQRVKPAMGGRASQQLNAVSFFTGVGGLMLGFMNAGIEILASYDRKTIVAKSIAENFPKVPHYHLDIGKLTLKEIRSHIGDQKLDVVFGGPPCQGFSIFGKRRFVKTKGYEVEADERNELTMQYIRLAVALEPSVIFMENVKGLYSASRGSSTYIATIERRLRNAGYDFEHKVINCANYGVPQLRERAVLVAWKKGLVFKWPDAKHHKNPKAWQRAYVTVGDVITDLMDPMTISDDFSHVPMAHKPLVVDRYKLIPEGGRLPENKLTKRLKQGYRTSAVKNYSHVFKRLAMDAPATTMVPGHNAFPVHPRLHRTLTVREAARIQTFPDNIKFLGTRQQQCMLAGNAVPPLLAEIFSHHIVKTIKGNFLDPGYKKDVYELKAHV